MLKKVLLIINKNHYNGAVDVFTAFQKIFWYCVAYKSIEKSTEEIRLIDSIAHL
jgi:hypothetical protein